MNHEGTCNNRVEKRKETKRTEYMQSYSVISDQPVVKCLVVPRVSMSATIDILVVDRGLTFIASILAFN